MKRHQWIGVAGLVSAPLWGALIWGALINVPAVGQATLNLPPFRESALSAHNTYRTVHHAPNLTASADLDRGAQDWANTMASSGDFKHSGVAGVGENIYATYSTESSVDAATLGKDAVKSWYDEVKDYDYTQPGFTSGTGHFTQVVWQGSTQLGCGAARGTTTIEGTPYNAFYVVCQYSAPGNMQGAFPENVKKP